MAVKKLLRMGHPVLRHVARPLQQEEFKSAEIAELLQDMSDTMKAEGGIGIAAPQIGVSLQLAIIEIPEETRYEGSEPTTRLIIANPILTVLDQDLQGFWEGCLSVPGLRGFVERPKKIRVDYLDRNGLAQSLEVEGFLATVFQHELDHLFGVLYVDRIKDTKLLSYTEEFVHFHQGGEPEVD